MQLKLWSKYTNDKRALGLHGVCDGLCVLLAVWTLWRDEAARVSGTVAVFLLQTVGRFELLRIPDIITCSHKPNWIQLNVIIFKSVLLCRIEAIFRCGRVTPFNFNMIYCDDSDALSQMLLIGVRPEDVLVSCHMTQIHMIWSRKL